MSKPGSGDDQSEDGELRQSPDSSRKLKAPLEYDSGEDEFADIDSLDIKPPQACILEHKSKKRDQEKSHHKRADREKRREERHSHRERHHREKSKLGRDKSHYHREREHYYKETTQNYEQGGYSEQHYLHGKQFQDRKSEDGKVRSEKKHSDKKSKESGKSHGKESNEKHKSSDEQRTSKALADLRERLTTELGLLGKCKSDEKHKHEKDGSRKHKAYRDEYENNEDPLEGEAGSFVKEILHLTTEERQHRKDAEKQLSEDERLQQELRKEKLLEAEREMARLKEQSKAERIRRYMERVTKRNDEDESLPKKFKKEPIQIVTVSDEENSDEVSDNSVAGNNEVSSTRSRDRRNRSRSRDQSPSKTSSEGESVYSERRSKSKSKSPSKSRSHTRSKSRSRSGSPVKDQPIEKLDLDLPPYYPAIQGCRSVEEFKCLNKIAEGTYGVVYRAKDKRTNEIVALKRLKMEKEKEGFPITSLREINTMLIGQHANIVTVREIVVGSNMDKIFIVMDYVEHDLKSLMETMKEKKQSFMPGEIKCLLQQLLQAVAHLHDNWILHRDLKTSNLLFSHKGILKVGDFGLAREYGSPLKPYTPIVVTLWYRAPELLLCSKEYSTPIDMWSVGCIFAEFLLMNALFPGKSEMDQLNRIFKELGTPNETVWPGFKNLPAVKKMNFQNYQVSNLRGRFNTLSEIGLGLLIKFLTYDPRQRVTAEDALRHAYFTEPPLPIDPAMFPTWPAKSELGYKRMHAASPKPPSGGREYKKLGGEDEDGYGFRIGAGIDVRRGGPGFSLKF